MTYAITTTSRDFSTESAASAASVACCWKRLGYEPMATVIIDAGDGSALRCGYVQVTTCRETARQLASVSRMLQSDTAYAAHREMERGTPPDWYAHEVDGGLSTPLSPDYDFRGHTAEYRTLEQWADV